EARLAAVALKAGYDQLVNLHADGDENRLGISANDMQVFQAASGFREPSRWSPTHPGPDSLWSRVGVYGLEVAAARSVLFTGTGWFPKISSSPLNWLGAAAIYGASMALNSYIERKSQDTRWLIDQQRNLRQMIKGLR